MSQKKKEQKPRPAITRLAVGIIGSFPQHPHSRNAIICFSGQHITAIQKKCAQKFSGVNVPIHGVPNSSSATRGQGKAIRFFAQLFLITFPPYNPHA